MVAALAVMRRETWAEYVQRVTRGVPRDEVARAAGVNVSGVSRWITGKTPRPSAEKAILFARGLHQRPVEALMAANYLNPNEVDGAFEVMRSQELSDDDLLAILAQRLAERPEVDDVTHPLATPDDDLESGEDSPGLD